MINKCKSFGFEKKHEKIPIRPPIKNKRSKPIYPK